MSEKIKVGIVGAGVVGQTLAALLADIQRYEVTLGSRSQGNVHSSVQNADIVLLTVSDGAIGSVCAELANQLTSTAVVAHCSGALTSDVLHHHSGPVASMHPLQTFPSVEAALLKVKGTYAYCEGDELAMCVVQDLAKALGMQPVEIASQDKPLYHAAAVMACNNLVALMESALQFGEAANINREIMWQSLKPLVDATVENINKRGTQAALTGPVARGDLQTLRSHMAAMKASDRVGDVQRGVYIELAKQAAALADRPLDIELLLK